MNAIHLKLLRNAEYLQFMKDYAAIIHLNDPTTLQIDAKLSAFETKSSELQDLFKKALASDKTKTVLELDERRDNAINGLTGYVQSLGYHFESVTRKNAQLLRDNLTLYGSGIARMNYQSETATLNNIYRDWTTKPDLMDAVIYLNLAPWLDELNDANTEFNVQFLTRTQEYGDANPETIKSKREETNVAYYALRDRIDALHTLTESPESPYSKLINQLNALIDQYNVLLMKRESGLPPDEMK
ncbi:DUF6261 family protein [Chryseobacterium sp. Leaf394]|uniref:DUF6261 family protein n=1 Tax=Chryseobacterium sp. Leaf394 TaxID=1736361 RepID=UPI0006F7EC92|nr:DUF6261 family protein [Chryseobacterium sp. Leaf394]KQS90169.1 hypothetical protein ASG21_14505 [Chryseobacterium sp. Leaf394]